MRLRDFSATSHGAWHLGFAPRIFDRDEDRRIDTIDFDTARADVEPYVMDRSELDIWNAEFFRQMVRMIKFA